MEFAPFIPLRPSQLILGLPRTELAEILRCLGDDIREEFELDAA